MPITPTNRARAALKARSDAMRADRGRELLAEALHLQQSTREQTTDPKSRRRRKQRDVIDLDQRISRNKSRHRLFVFLISVEALVAVVGVLVLAVVLVRGGAL